MPRLIVATGNPGKLQELQAYLEGTGWELALKPPELDIEETGETFLDNARLKATQVAIATGEWAIADDSGLAVDALDGAPGLYSARYGATDADRIQRVLTGLADKTDRAAQFICALAVVRPDGSVAAEAEGICPGEITHEPRGDNGFGYDPIFFVPELGLTYGEMSAAQKHHLSHRGRAIGLLLPQLAALNPA